MRGTAKFWSLWAQPPYTPSRASIRCLPRERRITKKVKVLPPRLVLALGLVALDLLQDQLLLPVDAALPLLARGLASPVCHKGRKLSCSSTAPLQQRQRGALPRSQP